MQAVHIKDIQNAGLTVMEVLSLLIFNSKFNYCPERYSWKVVCRVFIHALLLLSWLIKSVVPFDPGKLVLPMVAGNDSVVVDWAPWAWSGIMWAPVLISSFWDNLQPAMLHPWHGVTKWPRVLGLAYRVVWEGYLANSSFWLADTKLIWWDVTKLGS